MCKAGAAEKDVPLYRHIADLAGNSDLILPVPVRLCPWHPHSETSKETSKNVLGGRERRDTGLKGIQLNALSGKQAKASDLSGKDSRAKCLFLEWCIRFCPAHHHKRKGELEKAQERIRERSKMWTSFCKGKDYVN